MAVLEGTPPSEKINRSYREALTTNYMIWPFVQMVNFKVVPLQHRVLFVNVISIGWNCYLSYLNSAGEEQQQQQQEGSGSRVSAVVEEVKEGVEEVKEKQKVLS